MKNLLKRFAILIICSLALTSCGEDDTTNNPVTPVGTVLFALDSLGVSNDVSHSVVSALQSFGQTIQASHVSVEYRLQSNGDTNFCYARYQDTTNGTPSRPGEQLVTSPVDSAFIYLLDVSTQPFFIEFRVSVATRTILMPYYIKFKNIKVTKVQ